MNQSLDWLTTTVHEFFVLRDLKFEGRVPFLGELNLSKIGIEPTTYSVAGRATTN